MDVNMSKKAKVFMFSPTFHHFESVQTYVKHIWTGTLQKTTPLPNLVARPQFDAIMKNMERNLYL